MSGRDNGNPDHSSPRTPGACAVAILNFHGVLAPAPERRPMPIIPSLARFETGSNPPDAVAVRLFGDNGTEYAISLPRAQITVLMLELLRRRKSCRRW